MITDSTQYTSNTWWMQDWLLALQWAKQASEVKLVVLTGRGRFYSSGVQLQAPDFSPEGVAKTKERRKIVK